MSEHGIKDLSETQYRQADGIAQSDLKHIIPPKTPAHYWAYKNSPPKLQTPAQRMGSLLHTCLLQRDKWKENVVCRPDEMKFTTTEGKAWKKAHEGKEIVTLEEKTDINGMVESLWRHPIAKRLLEGGRMEASVFAEDNDGLLRKARIDCIPNGGNAIIDIKTTMDASREAFDKAVYEYGWYIQGAYYQDILKLIGQEREVFILIAVEKVFPYLVACYPVDVLSIEIGQKMYRGALKSIQLCTEAGHWPGFPENLDTFTGLPTWAMKGME